MCLNVCLNLPLGTTGQVLAQTASTMDAARAYDGPAPHWIMARSQTAGRGRQGRRWLARDGGFMATLIIHPNSTAGQAALSSFTMACALRDTMAGLVPPAKLQHKWPNDVLYGGGKVAGILLESSGGGQVDRLAIGVGVNLGAAPDGVPDSGFAPTGLNLNLMPEGFLERLAHHWAQRYGQFAAHGFAPIRTAWLDHAAHLGGVITARTAQGSHRGTFQGIDESGHLLLLTAGGRIAIPAADVYF